MKTELREYKFNELPISTNRIQLKKLRQWVGHDTNMGFTAELHIDGKKVANLEDDSHGGGIFISPDSEECRDTIHEIRKSVRLYPKMFWKSKGWTNPSKDSTFMSWDIECIIESLIELEEDRKWIQKKTTKCIFFRTADTTEGEWRTYPRRHKVSDKVLCPRDEERLFELIMKKHPDVTQIVGFRTREDWNAS